MKSLIEIVELKPSEVVSTNDSSAWQRKINAHIALQEDKGWVNQGMQVIPLQGFAILAFLRFTREGDDDATVPNEQDETGVL
jgi:hypothetical protein